MKLRYLFIVITLIVVALAACSSPAANSEDENNIPSPVQPIVDQAAEATPTKPALENTQIPSPQPSPTATSTPFPEVITKDTLSSLQINRSFRLFTGDLADFFVTEFSADNNLIAAWGCTRTRGSQACEEPLLVIFDTNSGKVLHKLELLTTVVEEMTFNPDGKTLAIAGCHTPIYAYGQPDTICNAPRVWLVDTSTGEMIRELKGYASPVKSIVFSKDGKILHTGVDYYKKYSFTDSTIRSWDLATGEELGEIQPDINNCTEVRLGISHDGNFLITHYINGCTNSQKIKWWDLQNQSSRAIGGGSGVRYAMSPDSSKIALIESFQNPVVHIYDIKTGEKINTISIGLRSSEITNFSFAPDNNSIVLSNYPLDGGEGLAVLDSTTGELLTRLNDPDFKISPNAGFVFSPEGEFLFVYGKFDDYETAADDQGALIGVWDATTWEKIQIPQPFWYLTPFDQPRYINFSPDQKSILVNSGSDVTEFGLPAVDQAMAKSILLDHLNKLEAGNYQAAAKDLFFEDFSILFGWIQSRLPGIDPEDIESVLKGLCADPRFPCLPVKDVKYEAQKDLNTFDFVVDFQNPDGSSKTWPSCEGLSPDDYCDFRDGFEYTVKLMEDGTYKIDGTLPYSMWLE
jgi:WD40 repeat protein